MTFERFDIISWPVYLTLVVAGEENHDCELSGLVHRLADALRLLSCARAAILVQP